MSAARRARALLATAAVGATLLAACASAPTVTGLARLASGSTAEVVVPARGETLDARLASTPRSSDADSGTSVSIQLLQPVPELAQEYAAAGIDAVTLELGWDAYQPTTATTDRSYVERRILEARAYADAGLDVVVDLGLQYPPGWAWDLPGGTRFVNQYGEVWHGGIGTDVLDGVWNDAVREAQRAYVAVVARDFAGLVDRVRVGGLLSGEIRLPSANAAGRTDSMWAFGAGALAASPRPEWRPGTGTADEAREWLDFYFSSLSDYLVWLTRSVADEFRLPIDVLMPGWGVRPGDVDRVADALVSTAAVETTGDDLAGGLDWPRQIAALDGLGLDITIVSTWLDAPSYGTAPRDLAPAEYLATWTRPLGIPLSGENTGGRGPEALSRVREQAELLDIRRITWMPDRTGGSAATVTPQDLGAAFPG